jgi:hypothetical protein
MLKRACWAEDAERVLIVAVISALFAFRISLRPLLPPSCCARPALVLVALASAVPTTPCSATNTPSAAPLTPLSLSHACTALVSATPLTPRARSSAICAHRRSCMTPRALHRPPPVAVPLSRVLGLRRRRAGGLSLFLSLVLRFARASTFVPGRKRQSGYRARCSAWACTARFSHSSRSAGGSVFHTIPIGDKGGRGVASAW